mmetsp:Transcript_51520/g.62090  ORF Transcript_51520/g.62090 Transcript_51520/m.62090 type:complete len:113 (-) Transcript_51520:102-440(-)
MVLKDTKLPVSQKKLRVHSKTIMNYCFCRGIYLFFLPRHTQIDKARVYSSPLSVLLIISIFLKFRNGYEVEPEPNRMKRKPRTKDAISGVDLNGTKQNESRNEFRFQNKSTQ